MLIGIDAHNLEGQRTGVGRYLINLLEQWNKFDLPKDLKFILYFKKEIPKDLVLKDSVFEKKILRAPFGLQSNAVFTHWLLCWSAKKDKLDILFCPAYVAPIFYRGKIALTLHDISYEAHPELYNWKSIFDRILLKKFSRISAKKAKVIFAPSEFSKKEVIKYYNIDAKKILVTPEGVDKSLKQIIDARKIEEIKKKYKIKNKFIFYIGSIFSRRHLPEVIMAFKKIAEQMPEYQFLIAGNNHTSPFIDIDELVRKVNQELGYQVILRQDYLDNRDLAVFYSVAELLIWLSDYEGFGLPVLESMACGAPVITSEKTSIPEVAGQSVIYVQDSTNIEEIYQAIYKGLTDKQLRQNLIKQGLEQSKKFSWKKCAEQTLEGMF
ncbi:MAG: glycosyltransferase family 1 protein [bacterium]